MSGYKKIVPCFALKDGTAVLRGEFTCNDPVGLCRIYSDNGADEIFIWEESDSGEAHERMIHLLKKMTHEADIPVAVGGFIKSMDDVKRYLYAGARTVVFGNRDSAQLLREAVERFGKERVAIRTDDISDGFIYAANGVSRVFFEGECDSPEVMEYIRAFPLPLFLDWQEDLADIPTVAGMLMSVPEEEVSSLMEEKLVWKKQGIPVNIYEPAFGWEELKKNSDGLVPVIAQDYITQEVLMLAYMNGEAFYQTMRTGKMTYYSRSRRELWEKGETSGHVQYVKEMLLDCDSDTILAKVSQVGAACHTGNRSCFYRELMKRDYEERNPLRVFEQVYQTILDRKETPKEGSYTNYLLEKGIDKILKKIGEEATEIVIAAKNPDPQETVYEISDFLYHMMVLMAVKDVNWQDITTELSNR